MSDTEIKMKELGCKIIDLKLEHEKLRSTYIKELQDKLSTLVGMSFEDESKYFRIIDIPIVQYNKSYTSFNEYKLPALIYYRDPTIYGDVGRLAIDTIFSEASHADNPIECIRSEYTEVPPEEFDAILDDAFNEIRALGRQGDAK